MDYRKFGDTVVARFDRGEEFTSSLQELCEKENIKLASVSAIGALNAFTAGVYMVDEKRYVKNEFKGCFEIVSLTGTVNTKGGKYYSHLHISAGDESGRVFGGHLNEAHISATAEVVIRMINGEVDRFYDDTTGLNLFKFKPTQIRICVVRSLGRSALFLISVDKRIICVILN